MQLQQGKAPEKKILNRIRAALRQVPFILIGDLVIVVRCSDALGVFAEAASGSAARGRRGHDRQTDDRPTAARRRRAG